MQSAFLPVVNDLNTRDGACLLCNHRRQRLLTRLFGFCLRHTVLRAAWAGETGFDGREVQLQRVVENGIGGGFCAKKTLRFRVRFDELDMLRITSGEPEVAERFGIDREETDRC